MTGLENREKHNNERKKKKGKRKLDVPLLSL
jgi:hypothetical protein